MGKYFTPPETLPVVGRSLNGSFTIQGLQSQLQPGEFLMGLYFNGIFNTAPWIESEEIFTHFEVSSIGTSYYAIDETTFAQYVQ